MIVPVLLFCVGLVCLIKGGDWFVDGATGIARRSHAHHDTVLVVTRGEFFIEILRYRLSYVVIARVGHISVQSQRVATVYFLFQGV